MLKLSEQLKAAMQTAAADVMYAERYCKEYMTKAQKLGLQGDKRQLRYYSVIYHNIGNYFNTDFYDLTGYDLMPRYTETEFEKVQDIPDFFKKLLAYNEQMYDKFHSSANAIQAANGYAYACILLKRVAEIGQDIKDYRRIVREGDICEWSEAYIQRLMLRQTTDKNKHDCYEDKEKEIGYNF